LPGLKIRKVDLLRCYPREISSEATYPGVQHRNGLRPNVLGKMSYVVKSPGVDPGFVGPEAYTSFGALLKKKNAKLQLTILDMKVNIYLGPHPGPWKESMQVRGPEA